MLHRDDGLSSWECLDPPAGLERYVSFEPYDPVTGSSELVYLPGHPLLHVSNRPGGGYATRDLYLPHPTIPGKWKYDKRKDDVIVHSHGVKSDPLTRTHNRFYPADLLVEGILLGCSHISHAIVFGADKPHVIAFIIPASDPRVQIYPP